MDEVGRYLAVHREYLARHYSAGNFITSGSQTPRVGGAICNTHLQASGFVNDHLTACICRQGK